MELFCFGSPQRPGPTSSLTSLGAKVHEQIVNHYEHFVNILSRFYGVNADERSKYDLERKYVRWTWEKVRKFFPDLVAQRILEDRRVHLTWREITRLDDLVRGKKKLTSGDRILAEVSLYAK